MAHKEQNDYFKYLSNRFSDEINKASNILEVGSKNLNGTVRDFFGEDTNYIGIDLSYGDCVDTVVPGELIQLPNAWADIVISTECFEHAENWDKIFLNMLRILKPGGLIFLTFAGFNRPTHGTIDCHEGSSPDTNNYYKNLGANDIAREIELGRYLIRHSFEINSISNDTYFWGIRSNDDFNAEFIPLEDLVARARGQLGMQIEKNLNFKKYIDKLEVQIHQLENQINQLENQNDQLEDQIDQLESQNMEILSSKSWRLTKPLRYLIEKIKNVKN